MIALVSGGEGGEPAAPEEAEDRVEEGPRRRSERREAGDWTAETIAVGIEEAEEMVLVSEEGENM